MKFTRTQQFVKNSDIQIKRKFVWWPMLFGSTIDNETRIETNSYRWLTYIYSVVIGADKSRITCWYDTATEAVNALFDDFIAASDQPISYRIKDVEARLRAVHPDNLIGNRYDIDNLYPTLYHDLVEKFHKLKEQSQ